MNSLLIVKTSSLGDVIHTLAAVTDAARAIPGLQCDWLVEDAYRDIPGWHPAVRRVIPCALRRWRKDIGAALRRGEWGRFKHAVQREPYDVILDAQGLLKSVFLARQARGPVTGRSFGSAREGLASLFYERRIAVDLQRTEVEQLRQLFALALDYPVPHSAADFGLRRYSFADASVKTPYAVLLHAAAWPSKLWPEERWIEVGRRLAGMGVRPLLPWGTENEKARAQRIAEAGGGDVLPALGYGALAGVLAEAWGVIGLDTGLTHLAVALGRRVLTLYGPSVPVFGDVARGELVNLCSTDSTVVDTRRPNTVPLERVLDVLTAWNARAATA